MKINAALRSFQPRVVIAAALLSAVFLLPAPKNSAQPPQPASAPNIPPSAAASCEVEGASYPVDGAGEMWAVVNGGEWVVVGHVVDGANGQIAIRLDGTSYAAACK